MIGTLLFITFFTNIGIATLNDKFNQQRRCLVLALTLSLISFQLFFVKQYISIFKSMFWVNMLFYLMFTTSIPPLLDKITLDYLNKVQNVDEMTYGRQRLFGTLGYLVANWILEFTLSTKSKIGSTAKKQFEYGRLKYYQAVTTLLSILLSVFLIKDSKKTKKRSDIMTSWRELMTNRAFIFFILIIFMNGITRASMTLYLTLYLTDVVQLRCYTIPTSIPKIISYSIAFFNENPLATIALFAVFLEITIMFYSKCIAKRFGLYWPLLFAQLFQLLRFAGYHALNPHSHHAFLYICLLELLKGINFGLTHTCAVQIATKLCPAHLKTTAQMIYSGTFTALSTVIGGIVFGHVLGSKTDESFAARVENYQAFFKLNIGITMVSVLLFVLRYGVFGKKLCVKTLTGQNKI